MAFRMENLKHVSTTGRNTVWYYTSNEDAIAAVAGSAYFNDAVTKLRQHDLVLVSASDNAGLRRVNSATGALPVTVTTGG